MEPLPVGGFSYGMMLRMTSPTPPNSPIAENVGWGFSIVKDPRNIHLISCVISYARCQFSFAMPPHAWEELLKGMPDAVTQAAAECRRLDSGIVVAGKQDVATLTRKDKSNGRLF